MTESLGTEVEEVVLISCNILVADVMTNSSVTRFPSTSTSQVQWSGRVEDFNINFLPATPSPLDL